MQKDVLFRFFEGSTTIEEEKKIRAWIESSPDHLKELFNERKIFDTTALLAVPEPITSRKEKRDNSLFFFPVWLKIAAAIVVTLLTTLFYQNQMLKKEQLAMQTITVPTGQRVNLILSDGTSVWLNSRTTMTYPVVFGKKTREVKINGEAFFDVAKNKKTPFIVYTKNSELEVLGTKFNVADYGKECSFSASLMEGSIKIYNANKKGNTLTLSPNTMVSFCGDSLVKKEIKDFAHYRWKEGLICFKEMSFANVMKELEKCYGIKIVIENKKVLKYMLTGKFRQVDGINYALNVLQKDFKFKFSRDEDKCIYIK